MAGQVLITSNPTAALAFLNENRPKERSFEARRAKIRERFAKRYDIVDDRTVVCGRPCPIDYLPVVDLMLHKTRKTPRLDAVVAAALYKIERDKCIFLTDIRDENLRQVYARHRSTANPLAHALWTVNTHARKYPLYLSHEIAAVLGGAFNITYGTSLGAWRASLRNG